MQTFTNEPKMADFTWQKKNAEYGANNFTRALQSAFEYVYNNFKTRYKTFSYNCSVTNSVENIFIKNIFQRGKKKFLEISANLLIS